MLADRLDDDEEVDPYRKKPVDVTPEDGQNNV